MPFTIFFSHSGQDSAWAEALKAQCAALDIQLYSYEYDS